MSALEKTYVTPEQYLELERKAEFKSEYYPGEKYALVCGAAAHSIIGVNVTGLLWSQSIGKPCTVFRSDMSVQVDSSGLCVYPDVTVVRGEIIYVDGKQDLLANPTVIVEVLSPSTEAYDRGEKWVHYRRMESLTDYVLVSQNKMLIEHFTRKPNDQWLLSVAYGPDAEAVIASIDCQLPLSRVYDKIESDPEGAMPRIRRLQF